MWMSEDSLWNGFSPTPHGAQLALRLGGKCLDAVNQLASPCFSKAKYLSELHRGKYLTLMRQYLC